jgi:hypothetical protein
MANGLYVDELVHSLTDNAGKSRERTRFVQRYNDFFNRLVRASAKLHHVADVRKNPVHDAYPTFPETTVYG